MTFRTDGMVLSGRQQLAGAEYVRREIETGRIESADITVLVAFFQKVHGLELDGKPGPRTMEKLREVAIGLRRVMPLPMLVNGGKQRAPQITSSFRSADRPDHDGVDLFYRFDPMLDQPIPVGDGGATRGPDGKPKWFIPPGTSAIAAEDGVVARAGKIATGFRVAIDHALGGTQSIYCHLASLAVKEGDYVSAGTPLGFVGDNPKDIDAKHLHFEISSSQKVYRPIDPQPWLRFAGSWLP